MDAKTPSKHILNPQATSGLPDPLASNEEKLSLEYALKVAKSIGHEWFGGGIIGDTCLFGERHLWIKKMRRYNRGEQDVEQYKKILARQAEDKDLLNMDWHITNYAEKFTNVVRNGITEDFYRIDIRSADKLSLLKKQQRVLEHKKNMHSKEMLEKAKELHGIDLVPKGFVPEDEEELNLYTHIKERDSHEIVEEILINHVKEVSDWGYIFKENVKDLVESDLMVTRIYTDPNNGVTCEYVDPECYGHSYVERKDFKDAFYHFVVETISINDIRRESRYDETTLRKIAALYAQRNGKNLNDSKTATLNQILDYQVDVMRYCLKSDKEIVYKAYQDKKNKTKKVAKRDSSYKVPVGAEKSRLSKRLDTWYEGSYIVGSDNLVFGWKESENLAKDSMNRVLPPFTAYSTNIYKNDLRSFLSNIIPSINKLIIADYKIQQLMLELKPDLIVMNLDQLAELSTDTKGAKKEDVWKTALSILNVKGVIFEKTIDMGDEGGVQQGQSARPAPNQQGSALGPLLNIWAHYYNIIRETTGINPAADGSLSEDALVGVNQLMRLAANTTTKHIADTALMFDKKVCETISTRVKGIFSLKEAKKIQKMYEEAVGKQNIEIIEGLKDRHLHEFGFSVEMVPAKQDLDELRQDLQIALQEGSIDVSEKSDIYRVARTNVKQAYEYMRYLRRRRMKEEMRKVEHNQKLQSQSNAQAAQMKAQSDLQLKQAQGQIDIAKEKELSKLRIEEALAMQQITSPEKEVDFQREVYLEKIKAVGGFNLTKFKEDEKTKREVANSTRQSKMIEQRDKKLGSFDFENQTDFSQLL